MSVWSRLQDRLGESRTTDTTREPGADNGAETAPEAGW